MLFLSTCTHTLLIFKKIGEIFFFVLVSLLIALKKICCVYDRKFKY